MEPELRILILCNTDILTARQRGRALAAEMGFPPIDQTFIATAISEMARNIVEHAKRGEVCIGVVEQGNKRGIQVVALDQGPGIADISRAMEDEYSTGPGLGLGLPGAKRLMDEFEIASQIGRGTTVTMRKWRGA